MEAQDKLNSMTDEFFKKIDFDRRVLSAILYFSKTEDEFKFPTIKEFILSELANVVIEYITGEKGDVRYQNLRMSEPCFEDKIWESIKQAFEKSDSKLSEAVKDSILRLTELKYSHPTGPDRPYPNPDIYSTFKGFGGCGGICEIIGKSTFSFSEETNRKIEKEILPSLSESTKNDCRAIGKIMRGYIQEDLEYIKEHYHW